MQFYVIFSQIILIKNWVTMQIEKNAEIKPFKIK